MKAKSKASWIHAALCGCGLFAALSTTTGCQVSVGGQMLPSPWYHTDDVQYHAPSSEFKLSKEAAALKAYKADQEAGATR